MLLVDLPFARLPFARLMVQIVVCCLFVVMVVLMLFPPTPAQPFARPLKLLLLELIAALVVLLALLQLAALMLVLLLPFARLVLVAQMQLFAKQVVQQEQPLKLKKLKADEASQSHPVDQPICQTNLKSARKPTLKKTNSV